MALGVLAVSVSVLAGFAGLPTMGQAAPFLVGAYTAGVLGTHGHTIGVVQLLCGTLTGAGFAAATGLVAVRTPRRGVPDDHAGARRAHGHRRRASGAP